MEQVEELQAKTPISPSEGLFVRRVLVVAGPELDPFVAR
jgi:hypothetical protein